VLGDAAESSSTTPWGARGWGRHWDEEVDVADVDEAVAEDAGHALVDLGDEVLGGFGGGLHDVGGDAEAAIAVLVGGLTEIMARSTTTRPVRNMRGISERKTGV